jgi:hypothetical protein
MPFLTTDIDWLVTEHKRLYARDEGFDDSFGVLVRETLETFAKDHDPTCETGWIASDNGTSLGSVFCVKIDKETAQLCCF